MFRNKSGSIVNLAEGEFTAAGVSERNAESYASFYFGVSTLSTRSTPENGGILSSYNEFSLVKQIKSSIVENASDVTVLAQP